MTLQLTIFDISRVDREDGRDQRLVYRNAWPLDSGTGASTTAPDPSRTAGDLSGLCMGLASLAVHFGAADQAALRFFTCEKASVALVNPSGETWIAAAVAGLPQYAAPNVAHVLRLHLRGLAAMLEAACGVADEWSRKLPPHVVGPDTARAWPWAPMVDAFGLHWAATWLSPVRLLLDPRGACDFFLGRPIVRPNVPRAAGTHARAVLSSAGLQAVLFVNQDVAVTSMGDKMTRAMATLHATMPTALDTGCPLLLLDDGPAAPRAGRAFSLHLAPATSDTQLRAVVWVENGRTARYNLAPAGASQTVTGTNTPADDVSVDFLFLGEAVALSRVLHELLIAVDVAVRSVAAATAAAAMPNAHDSTRAVQLLGSTAGYGLARSTLLADAPGGVVASAAAASREAVAAREERLGGGASSAMTSRAGSPAVGAGDIAEAFDAEGTLNGGMDETWTRASTVFATPAPAVDLAPGSPGAGKPPLPPSTTRRKLRPIGPAVAALGALTGERISYGTVAAIAWDLGTSTAADADCAFDLQATDAVTAIKAPATSAGDSVQLLLDKWDSVRVLGGGAAPGLESPRTTSGVSPTRGGPVRTSDNVEVANTWPDFFTATDGGSASSHARDATYTVDEGRFWCSAKQFGSRSAACMLVQPDSSAGSGHKSGVGLKRVLNQSAAFGSRIFFDVLPGLSTGQSGLSSHDR